MARICVFCGSRSGNLGEFAAAAELLGVCFAKSGHTLVYGGGSTGIMGILADAVLRNGGNVIGIIPRHLARPDLMHHGVADMRITVDMHERKALMHSLADAYLALPGGYGTLEELFEAVTWAQLEIHTRQVAVLNICGLFNGLVTMLDQMTEQGFLSLNCRRHLQVFTSTTQVLDWATSLATAR
ncbi:MAG: TIGR00730 family Rossman fold protein [Planctomycetota bacterium]|jgi:hypothetical protein|nr:TIGR00730 family Rossman fold protein [Planctomycetales bacterium]RLT06347.1 MAG: TIGR00730 family Rossman fold protein [Planctomycetota bacterium]